MASAGWALQRAVYETLTASAAVNGALGGPRIHDDVSRGAELPYVTIGQSSARDWSTGTEDGEEHTLTRQHKCLPYRRRFEIGFDDFSF